MSINDRQSTRVPIQIEVEFNHKKTGALTLTTRDISNSGIFIKIAPEKHPPIGTTAQVKIKNNFADGEEPPTLEMKVVRHSKSGIGLLFIDSL